MADDIVDTKKSENDGVKKLRGRDRNLAMFKEWVLGVSGAEIAARYGISAGAVTKIKQKEKWPAKLKELRELQFAEFGQALKGVTVKSMAALNKDLDRIIDKLNKNASNQLTDSERTHLRQLVEFASKGARVEDGKPTDIEEKRGVVEHHILLPPGVKQWGVIPPADNVKFIESKPKEAPKESIKDIIDLDELEDT